MIEPADREFVGVREHSAEGAAIAATIAALVLSAGVLLLGAFASEGWLRDAADWVRRGNNGVLIESAGVFAAVVVGAVSLFFTVRLIRLTHQSVEVAARSVEIAATASANAEKQHKRELVPVVILASYSEKRPSSPRARKRSARSILRGSEAFGLPTPDLASR